MYKLIRVFFALTVTVAFSCNTGSTENKSESSTDSTAVSAISNAKLEIIYFHSTNRCVTCNAVENNAKSLLAETFKSEFDNGDITFASLNMDESENNAITEKYQVSFSTLLLINHQNGEEVVTDFTETAFKYAKNEPEKYRELLMAEINKIIH